jgi:hypothetical protein
MDALKLLALASPAASWPGMPFVHARARRTAPATRVRVLAAAHDCDPAACIPTRLVKPYELLAAIQDSEHKIQALHGRSAESN